MILPIPRIIGKLDPRTTRLLKSCVRRKAPEHTRIPQITRMFWDPAGVLVATDGTKMVAVYDKAPLAWPSGLYFPGSRKRDLAMEEEVIKQGRKDGFLDWRSQIPSDECRTYHVGTTEIVRGTQAACVKAGVVVDWCLHGNALKALAEMWCDETRILCSRPFDSDSPFGPDRAVVVEQWRYRRQTVPDELTCVVRFVVMPCDPNLAWE